MRIFLGYICIRLKLDKMKHNTVERNAAQHNKNNTITSLEPL